MAAVMPMPVISQQPKLAVPLPTIAPYGLVELAAGQLVGTGWVPDIPDTRDYTEEHPRVANMIEKLNITKVKRATPLRLPTQMDLRQWCSPIENQGMLGSCTANAAAGVVEYFEKKAFNRFMDASRLFIYKTTRDLLGWTGDTGAYIRSTIGALVMFGTPPERLCPYTDSHDPTPSGGVAPFDEEPRAFLYEVAHKFETVNYICHDPFGTVVQPAALLNNVKTYVAAKIPAIFGFYVFQSYTQATKNGAFPFPAPGEKVVGGHAIVAVGYDDNMKITNTLNNRTTTGALLIRNSWGTGWGDAGYGWLPYDYVLSQYAHDFWSLLGMNWIDTGQFGI